MDGHICTVPCVLPSTAHNEPSNAPGRQAMHKCCSSASSNYVCCACTLLTLVHDSSHAVCGLRCGALHAGLRLEGPLQPDTAPGGDEAEEQPQSPLQRPPNYLSAMLTYMAQVHTSRRPHAAASLFAQSGIRSCTSYGVFTAVSCVHDSRRHAAGCMTCCCRAGRYLRYCHSCVHHADFCSYRLATQ